jgi:hypothetical protein
MQLRCGWTWRWKWRSDMPRARQPRLGSTQAVAFHEGRATWSTVGLPRAVTFSRPGNRRPLRRPSHRRLARLRLSSPNLGDRNRRTTCGRGLCADGCLERWICQARERADPLCISSCVAAHHRARPRSGRDWRRPASTTGQRSPTPTRPQSNRRPAPPPGPELRTRSRIPGWPPAQRGGSTDLGGRTPAAADDAAPTHRALVCVALGSPRRRVGGYGMACRLASGS